jgi:hypothetical protein
MVIAIEYKRDEYPREFSHMNIGKLVRMNGIVYTLTDIADDGLIVTERWQPKDTMNARGQGYNAQDSWNRALSRFHL